MSPYGSVDPARDWFNSASSGMFPQGSPYGSGYPGGGPFFPGGYPSYPGGAPIFPNMGGGGFPRNSINMPFSLDPSTWGAPTYTGSGTYYGGLDFYRNPYANGGYPVVNQWGYFV